VTPTTPSIKVGFNARLFPNDWRPAREEIAFAHAHGFSTLQFRGPVTGLDAARLGDPFAAVATALRAARLITVMEIVVPVNRTGRTASGTTPLDALRANLPAITALPCAHVHIHAIPDEPMSSGAGRTWWAPTGSRGCAPTYGASSPMPTSTPHPSVCGPCGNGARQGPPSGPPATMGHRAAHRQRWAAGQHSERRWPQ